jgi:hypothetical protein
MKIGPSSQAINGHAAKGLFGRSRRQPFIAVLRAINRYAAIYVCLALFFTACWWTHFAAFLKMEDSHRQFALMTERTMRAMAMLDWVTSNSWLAMVYVVMVVAAVAFAQFRRHPAWTYWLTALILCIPGLLYAGKCVYIMTVLFAG